MSQKQSAIQLQSVIKIYHTKQEKPTLFQSLSVKEKHIKFIALNSVSFNVDRGEAIGIIGSNGAGKTTLIKLISGITAPTSGRVIVRGSIVSITDLSAGFHPDFAGQDNVMLNGLLLGMTRSEILSKLTSIERYADIGSHFSAPLYTYSSGMKLRLGFAIAVHTNPDIFLIDESIMAGDENFQLKAKNKLLEYRRQKKTFVLVSHNLKYLQSITQRIIWIENGRVVKDGGHEVLGEYRNRSTNNSNLPKKV